MLSALLAVPKNWAICSSELQVSLAREPLRGSPGTASYAACAGTSRTHALLLRSEQSLKQNTFKPSADVHVDKEIRMPRLWRKLLWLNFMRVEIEVTLGYSVHLQVKRLRILFKNHSYVTCHLSASLFKPGFSSKHSWPECVLLDCWTCCHGLVLGKSWACKHWKKQNMYFVIFWHLFSFFWIGFAILDLHYHLSCHMFCIFFVILV